MSTVKVSNIYVEDLFQWFYDHIFSSGGDGAGLIVCQNYQEVADWFVEWHRKKYNRELNRDREEYGNIVNFHDSNENFMFSNTPTNWCDGDYQFIVEGDCKFGWHTNSEWKDRIIKGINNARINRSNK